MLKIVSVLSFILLFFHDGEKQTAKQTKSKILIDGLGVEKVWNTADWKPLDQAWIGKSPDPADFTGRYKLLWDENQLYLLAEIQDDTLIDIYKDKFDSWWDDDCLEIFIDEDASKGEHQYNHNAFAYHLALDGNVVDIGPDKNPHLYNNNVKFKHTQKGKITTWECAVKVYKDDFKDDVKTNIPVKLSNKKKLGFALAYCDNDKSERRENFIGSIPVSGEDKNRGWIDAGIFGELVLVK